MELQRQLSHYTALPTSLRHIIHQYYFGAFTMEQAGVIEAQLFFKQSLFLTGDAGTGKSSVLVRFTEIAEEHNRKVVVSGMTGIAASHIGGHTLHSVLSLSPDFAQRMNEMHQVGSSGFALHRSSDFSAFRIPTKTRQKVLNLDILIIEEASMLSAYQFESLDMLMRVVRKNTLPFGGVQLLLCGDFFQLGPIFKSLTTTTRPAKKVNKIIAPKADERYLFECPLWDRIFGSSECKDRSSGSESTSSSSSSNSNSSNNSIHQLTKIFRQEDQKLVSLLTHLRYNKITPEIIEQLRQLNTNENGDDDTVKLFARNQEANEENNRRIRLLNKPIWEHEATMTGRWREIPNATSELKLLLCIGAKVRLTRNKPKLNVWNGSIGEVIDRSEHGFPIVKFENGVVVEIEKEVQTLTEPHKQVSSSKKKNKKPTHTVVDVVVASFTQVPLQLSWASTIHKCQGLTLKKIMVDIKYIRDAQQLYTALSRCQSLDGLSITNFSGHWLSKFNARILNFARKYLRPVHFEKSTLTKILSKPVTSTLTTIDKDSSTSEIVKTLIAKQRQNEKEKTIITKETKRRLPPSSSLSNQESCKKYKLILEV